MDSPDDIVGHKTLSTGEIGPDGFPELKHEPLTRREAEALHERVEARTRKRAADMPDEQAAINAMFEAWQRLKELGWNGASYCPKDGTHFRCIELGSTGIFDGNYQGEWPDGHWFLYDEHDCYVTKPAMFRLYPEDEARHKEKTEAAAAKFRAALKAKDERRHFFRGNTRRI